MKYFKEIKLKSNCIIIFDDIRFWNILPFWRKIAHPKLDLTHVGHWAGTGAIQWTNEN